MPLPILLYPLLNLSLVQPCEAYSVCFQRRSSFGVLDCSFGIGRDGREGGVCVRCGVAFCEAGFDFEDGFGEEDGF